VKQKLRIQSWLTMNNKVGAIFLATALTTSLLCGNYGSLNKVTEPKYSNTHLGNKTFLEMVKPSRNAFQMKKTISLLMMRLGKTDYVFSGSDTRGWDCSGLVVWVYRHFGLDIPHSADEQGHIGIRVSKPALGDIVVFAHKGRTDFYHSGVYAGQNRVINANLFYGTTVLQSLKEYSQSQIRFVRVVNQK